MPRLLLKCALIATGMFALMGLIARSVGGTQPLNPALHGFTEGCEDKPQPCWYGIVPDVMTMSEIEKILIKLGYKEKRITMSDAEYYSADKIPQWVSFDRDCNDTIECAEAIPFDIQLSGLGNLGIGDILDTSHLILLDPDEISGIYILNQHYTLALENDWKSPNQRIRYIVLSSNIASENYQGYFNWHGFVSIEQYCHLEISFPSCEYIK